MDNPKLVIARGSSLNSWEMQNFAPLMDSFDIVGLSGKNNTYDTDSIKFPIEQILTLDDVRQSAGVLGRLPGAHRLGHRYLKLEKALEGAAIVHSAETFNVYSEQIAKLKSKLGFKFVLTVWENIPFLWNGVEGSNPKTHRRKQNVIKEVDHFIAITNRAREALLLEGVQDEKISVIPMGIDTERFKPQSKDVEMLEQFGLSEDDMVILTIANLHWYKGVQDLFFALGLMKTKGVLDAHKVKCLVVGSGEDQKEIYKLIDKVGISDIVRTVSKVPYEDIPKVHNLADVFFLGSWPSKVWQEQFGMVLVEAMACGKPIVTAESGSIAEVVSEAAQLVPPADFHRISGALRHLVHDSPKRESMGIYGRKRAESIFDTRVVASRLHKAYSSLLED